MAHGSGTATPSQAAAAPAAENPTPAAARLASDADPVAELFTITTRLGAKNDAALRQGLRDAAQLSPEERQKLLPLVRSLEGQLEADDADDAEDQLRSALEQVRALRSAETSPASAKADPHAAAERILARPEFQSAGQSADARVDKPDEPPAWWTRFWTWVGEQLEKLFKQKAPEHTIRPDGFALGGGMAELITYALVALAVCVLVVLLHRFVSSRRARGQEGGGGEEGADAAGSELDALAKPSWVWSEEADALAAQGRFREAIRSLYLALLSALHRRGDIDYHPALSNWAYCEQFRGAPGAVGPFRELTQRFDFGWYGRLGADADGYARFRTLCHPLMQREGRPDPSGPSAQGPTSRPDGPTPEASGA